MKEEWQGIWSTTIAQQLGSYEQNKKIEADTTEWASIWESAPTILKV